MVKDMTREQALQDFVNFMEEQRNNRKGNPETAQLEVSASRLGASTESGLSRHRGVGLREKKEAKQ